MNPRALFIKNLSVFLATVMLTEAVFAHAPELNFWKERSLSLRGAPSATKQSQVPGCPEIASLPAGARNDKFVNLTQFGSIRKITKGQTGPTIFHIQDVHNNTEAQANIEGAVQNLIGLEKTDLIALEGAFGPLDLKYFQEFPRHDAVKNVADYLLREHKISGPVHGLLTAAKTTLPVIGIDDRLHYDANVRAVKNAYRQKDRLQKQLQEQHAALAREKETVFNPELKKFDRAVEAYRNGALAMGDYVELLARHSPEMSLSIETFLQALALERQMNTAQVEHERSFLIQELVTKLDEAHIRALTEMSAAFQAGRINHAEFYSYLEKLCAARHVPLERFAAMKAYVQYVLLSNSIDGDALAHETQALEKTVYDALAKTEDEKKLAARSRALYLTERLADFALTKDEWEEYTNAGVSDAGVPDLAPFEDFYREAQTRDRLMAENLRAAIKKTGAKNVVLVTGGFHTNGIRSVILSEGRMPQAKDLKRSYTYISFVPKISQVASAKGSEYLSVFAQEKTPLDKLFAGEKLFLAGAPMIAAPSFKKTLILYLSSGLSVARVFGREKWEMVKAAGGVVVEKISAVPAAVSARLSWPVIASVFAAMFAPGLAMLGSTIGGSDDFPSQHLADWEKEEIRTRVGLLKKHFDQMTDQEKETLLYPEILLVVLGIKPFYLRFPEYNEPDPDVLKPFFDRSEEFWRELGITFNSLVVMFLPLMVHRVLAHADFLREKGILLDSDGEALKKTMQALERQDGDAFYEEGSQLVNSLFERVADNEDKRDILIGFFMNYPLEDIITNNEMRRFHEQFPDRLPPMQNVKSTKYPSLQLVTYGGVEGARYLARYEETLDYAYAQLRPIPGFFGAARKWGISGTTLLALLAGMFMPGVSIIGATITNVRDDFPARFLSVGQKNLVRGRVAILKKNAHLFTPEEKLSLFHPHILAVLIGMKPFYLRFAEYAEPDVKLAKNALARIPEAWNNFGIMFWTDGLFDARQVYTRLLSQGKYLEDRGILAMEDVRQFADRVTGAVNGPALADYLQKTMIYVGGVQYYRDALSGFLMGYPLEDIFDPARWDEFGQIAASKYSRTLALRTRGGGEAAQLMASYDEALDFAYGQLKGVSGFQAVVRTWRLPLLGALLIIGAALFGLPWLATHPKFATGVGVSMVVAMAFNNGSKTFDAQEHLFTPGPRHLTTVDESGGVVIRPEFNALLGNVDVNQSNFKMFPDFPVKAAYVPHRAHRHSAWESIEAESDCPLCGLIHMKSDSSINVGDGFVAVPEEFPYFGVTGTIVKATHQEPQIDFDLVRSMLQTLYELGPFGFRVGYNHRGAGQKITHQSYRVFPQELPIEQAATIPFLEYQGLTVQRLVNFPMKGFVVEARSFERLLDELYRIESLLELLDVPFNLLMSESKDGLIRVFVILREKNGHSSGPLKDKVFGVVEAGGIALFEEEKDFNMPGLEEELRTAYEKITPSVEDEERIAYTYKAHAAVAHYATAHDVDYEVDALGNTFFVFKIPAIGEVLKFFRSSAGMEGNRSSHWDDLFLQGLDIAVTRLGGIFTPTKGVRINSDATIREPSGNEEPTYIIQKMVPGPMFLEQLQNLLAEPRIDIPRVMAMYEGLVAFHVRLIAAGVFDIDVVRPMINLLGETDLVGFDTSHLRKSDVGVNVFGNGGYAADWEDKFNEHIDEVAQTHPDVGRALKKRFGFFSWQDEIARAGLPKQAQPMARWISQLESGPTLILLGIIGVSIISYVSPKLGTGLSVALVVALALGSGSFGPTGNESRIGLSRLPLTSVEERMLRKAGLTNLRKIREADLSRLMANRKLTAWNVHAIRTIVSLWDQKHGNPPDYRFLIKPDADLLEKPMPIKDWSTQPSSVGIPAGNKLRDHRLQRYRTIIRQSEKTLRQKGFSFKEITEVRRQLAVHGLSLEMDAAAVAAWEAMWLPGKPEPSSLGYIITRNKTVGFWWMAAEMIALSWILFHAPFLLAARTIVVYYILHLFADWTWRGESRAPPYVSAIAQFAVFGAYIAVQPWLQSMPFLIFFPIELHLLFDLLLMDILPLTKKSGVNLNPGSSSLVMDGVIRRLDRVVLNGTFKPRALEKEPLVGPAIADPQKRALYEQAMSNLEAVFGVIGTEFSPELAAEVKEKLSVVGLYTLTHLLIGKPFSADYRWGMVRNSRSRTTVFIPIGTFARMTSPLMRRWLAFTLVYGLRWSQRYQEVSQAENKPTNDEIHAAMKKFDKEWAAKEMIYVTPRFFLSHLKAVVLDRITIWQEQRHLRHRFADIKRKASVLEGNVHDILASDEFVNPETGVLDRNKVKARYGDRRKDIIDVDRALEDLALEAMAFGEYEMAYEMVRWCNYLCVYDSGILPMDRYLWMLRMLVRTRRFDRLENALHNLLLKQIRLDVPVNGEIRTVYVEIDNGELENFLARAKGEDFYAWVDTSLARQAQIIERPEPRRQTSAARNQALDLLDKLSAGKSGSKFKKDTETLWIKGARVYQRHTAPQPVRMEIRDDAFAEQGRDGFSGPNDPLLRKVLDVASHRDIEGTLLEGRKLVVPLPPGRTITRNNIVFDQIVLKAVTYEGGLVRAKAYPKESPTHTHLQPREVRAYKEGTMQVAPAEDRPKGGMFLESARNEYRIMDTLFSNGFNTGCPFGVGELTAINFSRRPGEAPEKLGFVAYLRRSTDAERIWTQLNGDSSLEWLVGQSNGWSSIDISQTFAYKMARWLGRMHRVGVTHRSPHIDQFGGSIAGDISGWDFDNASLAADVKSDEHILFVLDDFIQGLGALKERLDALESSRDVDYHVNLRELVEIYMAGYAAGQGWDAATLQGLGAVFNDAELGAVFREWDSVDDGPKRLVDFKHPFFNFIASNIPPRNDFMRTRIVPLNIFFPLIKWGLDALWRKDLKRAWIRDVAEISAFVYGVVAGPLWETWGLQWMRQSGLGIMGTWFVFFAAHAIVYWLVRAARGPDNRRISMYSLAWMSFLIVFPFFAIPDTRYAFGISLVIHSLINLELLIRNIHSPFFSLAKGFQYFTEILEGRTGKDINLPMYRLAERIKKAQKLFRFFYEKKITRMKLNHNVIRVLQWNQMLNPISNPSHSRQVIVQRQFQNAVETNPPDIITLQEVTMGPNGGSSAHLLAIQFGYEAYVKDLPTLHGSGMAILFRRSFRIMVRHEQPLPGGGKLIGLTLRSILNKKVVHVFTTHLAADPKAQLERRRSLLYAQSYMGRLPVDDTVILAGDFNFANEEEIEAAAELLPGFTDSFKEANPGQQGATISEHNPLTRNYSQGKAPFQNKRVDLIFVRNAGIVDSHITLNEHPFPSDHYGLQTDINLGPKVMPEEKRGGILLRLFAGQRLWRGIARLFPEQDIERDPFEPTAWVHHMHAEDGTRLRMRWMAAKRARVQLRDGRKIPLETFLINQARDVVRPRFPLLERIFPFLSYVLRVWATFTVNNKTVEVVLHGSFLFSRKYSDIDVDVILDGKKVVRELLTRFASSVTVVFPDEYQIGELPLHSSLFGVEKDGPQEPSLNDSFLVMHAYNGIRLGGSASFEKPLREKILFAVEEYLGAIRAVRGSMVFGQARGHITSFLYFMLTQLQDEGERVNVLKMLNQLEGMSTDDYDDSIIDSFLDQGRKLFNSLIHKSGLAADQYQSAFKEKGRYIRNAKIYLATAQSKMNTTYIENNAVWALMRTALEVYLAYPTDDTLSMVVDLENMRYGEFDAEKKAQALQAYTALSKIIEHLEDQNPPSSPSSRPNGDEQLKHKSGPGLMILLPFVLGMLGFGALGMTFSHHHKKKIDPIVYLQDVYIHLKERLEEGLPSHHAYEKDRRAQLTFSMIWFEPKRFDTPTLHVWESVMTTVVDAVLAHNIHPRNFVQLFDLLKQAEAFYREYEQSGMIDYSEELHRFEHYLLNEWQPKDPELVTYETHGEEIPPVPADAYITSVIPRSAGGMLAFNTVNHAGTDFSARLVSDWYQNGLRILELKRNVDAPGNYAGWNRRIVTDVIEQARKDGASYIQFITAARVYQSAHGVAPNGLYKHYSQLPYDMGFRLTFTDTPPHDHQALMRTPYLMWERPLKREPPIAFQTLLIWLLGMFGFGAIGMVHSGQSEPEPTMWDLLAQGAGLMKMLEAAAREVDEVDHHSNGAAIRKMVAEFKEIRAINPEKVTTSDNEHASMSIESEGGPMYLSLNWNMLSDVLVQARDMMKINPAAARFALVYIKALLIKESVHYIAPERMNRISRFFNYAPYFNMLTARNLLATAWARSMIAMFFHEEALGYLVAGQYFESQGWPLELIEAESAGIQGPMARIFDGAQRTLGKASVDTEVSLGRLDMIKYGVLHDFLRGKIHHPWLVAIFNFVVEIERTAGRVAAEEGRGFHLARNAFSFVWETLYFSGEYGEYFDYLWPINRPERIEPQDAYFRMHDAFRQAGLDPMRAYFLAIVFDSWRHQPGSRAEMTRILMSHGLTANEAQRVVVHFDFKDRPSEPPPIGGVILVLSLVVAAFIGALFDPKFGFAMSCLVAGAAVLAPSWLSQILDKEANSPDQAAAQIAQFLIDNPEALPSARAYADQTATASAQLVRHVLVRRGWSRRQFLSTVARMSAIPYMRGMQGAVVSMGKIFKVGFDPLIRFDHDTPAHQEFISGYSGWADFTDPRWIKNMARLKQLAESPFSDSTVHEALAVVIDEPELDADLLAVAHFEHPINVVLGTILGRGQRSGALEEHHAAMDEVIGHAVPRGVGTSNIQANNVATYVRNHVAQGGAVTKGFVDSLWGDMVDTASGLFHGIQTNIQTKLATVVIRNSAPDLPRPVQTAPVQTSVPVQSVPDPVQPVSNPVQPNPVELGDHVNKKLSLTVVDLGVEGQTTLDHALQSPTLDEHTTDVVFVDRSLAGHIPALMSSVNPRRQTVFIAETLEMTHALLAAGYKANVDVINGAGVIFAGDQIHLAQVEPYFEERPILYSKILDVMHSDQGINVVTSTEVNLIFDKLKNNSMFVRKNTNFIVINKILEVLAAFKAPPLDVILRAGWKALLAA